MKTSTFSIQDCEKHFRKYVRRKSDTNSHNFDTTKLHKISVTNNTHGGHCPHKIKNSAVNHDRALYKLIKNDLKKLFKFVCEIIL